MHVKFHTSSINEAIVIIAREEKLSRCQYGCDAVAQCHRVTAEPRLHTAQTHLNTLEDQMEAGIGSGTFCCIIITTIIVVVIIIVAVGVIIIFPENLRTIVRTPREEMKHSRGYDGLFRAGGTGENETIRESHNGSIAYIFFQGVVALAERNYIEEAAPRFQPCTTLQREFVDEK